MANFGRESVVTRLSEEEKTRLAEMDSPGAGIRS
jgi:hypothetical protein